MSGKGFQDSAVVTALRCYSSKDDFEDSGNMLYIYIIYRYRIFVGCRGMAVGEL